MHLLFQKVNKNIVWGRYIDWDNRYFFALFIWAAHTLLLNQFIFYVEGCEVHDR